MDDYEDNYIEESAPPTREEAEPSQEAEQNYEAEARKQGWKPKEEFDGPQDKWRPAKEFVDRGNEDPRILRSRVDKLDKLYEGVKKQWQADLKAKEAEFNERVERHSRMAERALREQRQTYEQQIAAAKREATLTGDVERYDQIEQHERAVKQQWARDDKETAPQAQTTARAPTPAPEVNNWIAKNPWFNKDHALTEVATAYEDYLARAKPGLSLDERLEETRRHVVAEFPHKFGKKAAGMNGASRGGSPVEGAQRGANGGSSDDGGFSDAHAEVKAQFKSFVKEGLYKDIAADRKRYMTYYNNPNADKVRG